MYCNGRVKAVEGGLVQAAVFLSIQVTRRIVQWGLRQRHRWA
jgi:hypothetical protein